MKTLAHFITSQAIMGRFQLMRGRFGLYVKEIMSWTLSWAKNVATMFTKKDQSSVHLKLFSEKGTVLLFAILIRSIKTMKLMK